MLPTEAATAQKSGRIEARTGLRMMPTFPRPSLSFHTAGFPQYGWKAGFPSGAFPDHQRSKRTLGRARRRWIRKQGLLDPDRRDRHPLPAGRTIGRLRSPRPLEDHRPGCRTAPRRDGRTVRDRWADERDDLPRIRRTMSGSNALICHRIHLISTRSSRSSANSSAPAKGRRAHRSETLAQNSRALTPGFTRSRSLASARPAQSVNLLPFLHRHPIFRKSPENLQKNCR
jgi:hypothetical protein